MAYLKEDGSLDVDRYRKLSNEDYKREIVKLTEVQLDEYYSTKLRVLESVQTIIPMENDYSYEDAIVRDEIIDANEFLDNIIKKYGG